MFSLLMARGVGVAFVVAGSAGCLVMFFIIGMNNVNN